MTNVLIGPLANAKEFDSRESSFREKLLEHVFISELLQELWLSQGRTANILRPEVDRDGYDLALECEGVYRYIQLKGSKLDAKTSSQTVNDKLASKPGGCVVWLFYEVVNERIKLKYLFFGKGPGERPDLGYKRGKHSKADAKGVKKERPNTRVIGISKFTKLDGIDELVNVLFTPASNLTN